MKRDTGLDTLLSMDGYKHVLDNSYWWKIKASMDNAHIPKNRRKGFHGRIVEYDHVHNNENDRGTPYAFVSAEKLIIDFLNM